LLFLGNNFQTTNARKPTKGSKDADFGLDFIFFKTNFWGWGKSPMNVGQAKA